MSPGCVHCYAEKLGARFSDRGNWGEGFAEFVTRPDGEREARWTGKVEPLPDALELPLRWRRPRMIFVNSLSDLFHEKLPDEEIDKVMAVMALSPRHTFQVLTKRADRMRDYMNKLDHETHRETVARIAGAMPEHPWPRFDVLEFPSRNVWMGVSVEDQERADERLSCLLDTPAAVRFVSYEPALGPVDFTRWLDRLGWVIVGGESGPNARTFKLGWARSTVLQCTAAGVPCFVKQLGSNPIGADKMPFHTGDRKGDDMDKWPQDLRVREWPKARP